MSCRGVTITGADDAVSIESLAELSHEFPFVEWGILVSPRRFGEARYPSTKWLMCLDSNPELRVSFHMCGAFARDVLAGDPTFVPRGIKRMQLNGFGKYHRLPGLSCAAYATDVEFVLQCGDKGALEHAVELRSMYTNVVALWDPSGGIGRSFMEGDVWYPRPGAFAIPLGYAGGITEDNIEDTIAALPQSHDFWIDLETGARTNNEFDLAKVRRMLTVAAHYIQP